MRRPSCPLCPQGAPFPPDRLLDCSSTCDPCKLGVLQRPSYEHLSSQLSGSTFHTPIPLLTGTPILDFPNASHPKKHKRETASQGPGTLPWTLGTPHSHSFQTPFPQAPEPLNSEIPHFDSKAGKSAPVASHGTPQVPENLHCLQNQHSQDPTPKGRNLRFSSLNKPGIPQHSSARIWDPSSWGLSPSSPGILLLPPGTPPSGPPPRTHRRGSRVPPGPPRRARRCPRWW